MEYYQLISRSKVKGITLDTVVGCNDDIDTATIPEDLWMVGGLYTFPPTADYLEVLSNSASDTRTGSGVQYLTINGLDLAYRRLSEIITISGTTPVTTSGQYLRVNEFVATTAGLANQNVGTITLRRKSAPNVTMASIAPGDGHMRQAIYTVPSGTTAYLHEAVLSIRRALTAEVAEIVLYHRNAETSSPWLAHNFYTVSAQGTNTFEISQKIPDAFTEKQDIRLACTYASANNLSVCGSLILAVVDNSRVL